MTWAWQSLKIVTWTSVHDTVHSSKQDTPAFIVKDNHHTGLKNGS